MKQKHLIIALAVVLVGGLVYLGTSGTLLQGKFSVSPAPLSLCKTDTLVFSGGTDTVEDFIDLVTDMSAGVSCPYSLTGLNEQFDHGLSFECESSDMEIYADATAPLYSISCTHDFGDVSKQFNVSINDSSYALTDPAADHLYAVFEDERDNVFEHLVFDPEYVQITRESK